MAAHGFNVVRLVSLVADRAAAGQIDEAYLDLVPGHGRDAAARHLLGHRHAPGRVGQGDRLRRPASSCPAGTSPAIGWDGAPAWATITDGASTCTPGSGRGQRRRAHGLGQLLRRPRPVMTPPRPPCGACSAGVFAHEPAVAGFDLLNEPNHGRRPDFARRLGTFFGRSIEAIRAGERSVGGSHTSCHLRDHGVRRRGAVRLHRPTATRVRGPQLRRVDRSRAPSSCCSTTSSRRPRVRRALVDRRVRMVLGRARLVVHTLRPRPRRAGLDRWGLVALAVRVRRPAALARGCLAPDRGSRSSTGSAVAVGRHTPTRRALSAPTRSPRRPSPPSAPPAAAAGSWCRGGRRVRAGWTSGTSPESGADTWSPPRRRRRPGQPAACR